MHLLLYAVVFAASSFATAAAALAGKSSGLYVSVEWMDVRRVLMRVPSDADLPPSEEEVVLDELEHWKWRVEMAAAGGAVLVTFSQCPHGLGLLPAALEWKGGGQWRSWPGTFQYARGVFSALLSYSSEDGNWVAISTTHACEGAAGLSRLGKDLVGHDLNACRAECRRRRGCKAVDYYRSTEWCVFYDSACKDPKSNHDGASSYRLIAGGGIKEESALHAASMSFAAAKQWCQEEPACKGFSHQVEWSDQERETGVVQKVLFSSGAEVVARNKVEGKWHSYVHRDNPRANCNPEGEQFECPNNPYACLGLSMDADENAVKQAYRALSKKMHPDKIKASNRTKETIKQAEAAFRDISEAHESLLNQRSRRQVDRRLQQERHDWQQERQAVQDLYIKEPQVSSLEPESFPVMMPKGQEWVVHFFMPTNAECKQMKVAMGRVVQELGTGEEERYRPVPKRRLNTRFLDGDEFRGRLRMKSLALKNSGSYGQEGDSHLALVVTGSGAGKLHLDEEVLDVTIQVTQPSSEDGNAGQVQASLRGEGKLLKGVWEKKGDWFRGAVLVNAREVGSFLLQRDTWAPKEAPFRGSKRQLPRLFGAVNCGRFPDFCRSKGLNPQRGKDFPQVRVIFPGDNRYELYTGKPLGKELVPFARETTRQTGPVEQLDLNAVAALQASTAVTPWMLLLQRTQTSGDCPLARSALHMLRRTAPQLARSRLRPAWVNCTTDAAICEALDTEGPTPCWGVVVLAQIGGQGGAVVGEDSCIGCRGCAFNANTSLVACPECSFSQAAGKPPRRVPLSLPLPSLVPLWNMEALQGGEIGAQGLLAALEGAARTAEVLQVPRGAQKEHPQPAPAETPESHAAGRGQEL